MVTLKGMNNKQVNKQIPVNKTYDPQKFNFKLHTAASKIDLCLKQIEYFQYFRSTCFLLHRKRCSDMLKKINSMKRLSGSFLTATEHK